MIRVIMVDMVIMVIVVILVWGLERKYKNLAQAKKEKPGLGIRKKIIKKTGPVIKKKIQKPGPGTKRKTWSVQ